MEDLKSLRVVQLLHNPTAGDEEHDKKILVELFESNGFECRYSSTKKKEWKGFDPEADFIAIAGGDGTVRKMCKALLDRKLIDHQLPIAVIPLGTANNIAKTLEIEKKPEEIIPQIRSGSIKKFDVGKISNIEDAHFFLESFGYGLFPYMVKEMKKRNKDKEPGTPEEALKSALKLLHELIQSYEPRYCSLEIDGVDHSGKYLLLEIMNTRSIGPNLFLSPDADPGDGLLEVVMIPESSKDLFASYVQGKINGTEADYDFRGVHAKKIKICWGGTHVHVDDEVLKMEKDHEVEIEMRQGILHFIVY